MRERELREAPFIIGPLQYHFIQAERAAHQEDQRFYTLVCSRLKKFGQLFGRHFFALLIECDQVVIFLQPFEVVQSSWRQPAVAIPLADLPGRGPTSKVRLLKIATRRHP